MVTYSHLARELEDTCTLDLRLWRLDVAVAPEYSAHVEHDIETAELIIIAVRGSQPCPPAFQRWKCADGVSHCAIIAFTDGPEALAPALGSWDSVLRTAATPIHPEIFVWEPAAKASQQPELGAATQRAAFSGADRCSARGS